MPHILSQCALGAHKASHQMGGSDELNLAGLQPSVHKESHQVSGSDELNLTALQGKTLLTDRGDPTAYDWTLANFTRDSAWHDLNCSSIVPAGANFISFGITLKNNMADQAANFRKKGNSIGFTAIVFTTHIANQRQFGHFTIPCDTNRKIQYLFGTPDNWTIINLIILGWFT